MNICKVKIRGKKREIVFPISKEDIKHQVAEIFAAGHYDKGKKKDGVIIDAGANIGLVSIHYADVAKKIYALEPSPDIFEALKENTKDYKNIECFNVGLSYENATRPFYPGKEGEPAQTVFGGPDGGILVNFVTLYDFMKDNKIKHVDTLKMDIEGSEYLVLPDKSFEDVAEKIDMIIGEGHYTGGAFPEAIPHILKEYGYKTKFIKTKGGNFIRSIKFTNLATATVKKYDVLFDTMFIAKR
jgi:FkbM family methyltransferase